MLLVVTLLIAAPPGPAGASPAASGCVRVAAGDRVGSGAVVGTRGAFLFVLTAAHVVGAGEDVTVVPFRPDGTVRAALGDPTVLLRRPDLDLALVRVFAGDDPPPVQALVPPGEAPRDGPFSAASIGCGDAAPDRRAERVLGKKLLRRPGGDTVFVWEAEARPEPGRSGSPLLDDRGRVLGVCSGTQGGKGYYVHPDEIHAALKKAGYAWLSGDQGVGSRE